MDQIDIAKLIAYLMVLPPHSEFCRLVQELAEATPEEDKMRSEDRYFEDILADRLTQVAWELEEDIEYWEREAELSVMEITQRIVSSPIIMTEYNMIRSHS